MASTVANHFRRALWLAMAMTATVATGGCGNGTPPLRTRTQLTREVSVGTSRHIPLREVICDNGAWRQGTTPIDAVLVSACCMLTTDPVVVARGPEESAALTIMAGAVPHAEGRSEITTEDLSAVCAASSDDGFSVLPRPEVSIPGYAISTVSVSAGTAVKVDVDGTDVPGVVVEIDGSRFTVEYIPSEAPAAGGPPRVGTVLTRDGVDLLGVILHASRVPGRTARAVAVGAADVENILHQCGVVTSEPVCRPVARIDTVLKVLVRLSTDQIIESVLVVMVVVTVPVLVALLFRKRRRVAQSMKATDK